jgi:prepilin-type processing-associated H-X9-DG protein
MNKAFLLCALLVTGMARADEISTPPIAPDGSTPDATATNPGKARPATVQPANVQQITLPNLPTEIKFQDLTKNWRRFTLDQKEVQNPYGYNQWGPAYESVLNDLGIGVHFTKGDNLVIGKESYLIAYRVDPGLDAQELQQEIQSRMQRFWGGGHGAQPAPVRPAGKFSGRASLKLALLNLRNAGDLKDLRTFDPKRDLLQPADLREMSNQNLKRLGQFLRQFQANGWTNNQGLPLRDARALRTMLQTFFHAGAGATRDPATNESYHVNTALSGKRPDRIGNKKAIAAVYEGAPSGDGTRGVLFLDGHVERLPDWKWKVVRSAKIQGPTPREFRELSNKQLKTIGQQLLNFAQYQYDKGFLPRIESDYQTQRNLMRYFGWNQNVYRHPETRKPYRFNKAISRLKLREISNRKQLVAAYEADAGSDGKIGAVFLDGRVYRIAASDWNRVLGAKPKLKAAKKS